MFIRRPVYDDLCWYDCDVGVNEGSDWERGYGLAEVVSLILIRVLKVTSVIIKKYTLFKVDQFNLISFGYDNYYMSKICCISLAVRISRNFAPRIQGKVMLHTAPRELFAKVN